MECQEYCTVTLQSSVQLWQYGPGLGCDTSRRLSQSSFSRGRQWSSVESLVCCLPSSSPVQASPIGMIRPCPPRTWEVEREPPPYAKASTAYGYSQKRLNRGNHPKGQAIRIPFISKSRGVSPVLLSGLPRRGVAILAEPHGTSGLVACVPLFGLFFGLPFVLCPDRGHGMHLRLPRLVCSSTVVVD